MEKYIVDIPSSIFNGAIVDGSNFRKGFGSYELLEAPYKLLQAGAVIGYKYTFHDSQLRIFEPPYLQYDPTQQADSEDDI